MSNPYPWIKDSKYGTTPSVTNYLEVTSSKGLYLNYANSTVLLKNPATSESLTMSKSAIDFYSTNGTSCVLIDNTHIHLNEQTPTTTPFTTDITNQNIILQSQNNTTPYLQTLTIQPNTIQQLNPDFSMIMGTGSYQTQSLAVARTSTLNPYVCSVGFDGSGYQGDVNCLNVNCGNNLQVVTINGLAPTTIGLVWADFNNAYPNLLNGRYYLTDTTYESYQDTQQFYARNMSVNQYASYDWNGIDANGGSFTLQTNSHNFDLYCATFNINGIPYSPGGGGGGVTDIQAGPGISVNQNTGSVTITNTGSGGGGVTDIQAGPGISVNQTTGSVTITNTGGGGGSQDLNTTLSINNNSYGYAINMNGNDINSVNNINVSTINGSSYPPATPLPENYYFGLQSTYANNNSSTQFTSNTITILTTGNYTITWTFVFDSLFQSPGDKQMVSAYGYLHESGGAGFTIQGAIQNSGVAGSSYISTDTSYRTSYTYTDVYNIYATATFYACILQYNTTATGTTVYMTASVVKMAN